MKALARVVGPLASSFDRIVSSSITGRSAGGRRRSRAESLGPRERAEALRAIEAVYERARPFEDVDAFFGAPSLAAPRLEKVGSRDVEGERVDVVDASWSSRVDTFCDDPRLLERFAAMRENHEAKARLFLHAGPREGKRPVVILVHGYRAGQHAVEERVWPTKWLLARGLDVALFVLPFHSVRATPLAPPRFPGSDPRFTNEGFRQAIHDLRGLVTFFHERGAPHVGAMGMSLGGYTVSLLATVEPRLSFATMMIPLASFADVARAAGRLVGTEAEQEEQHAMLERAHAVVSPFARTPKVDPAAVVVIGGEGDRITPIAHAERLARHFEGELVRFPGGHLLQIGRGEGFRAVGRMLARRGIFDARRV